MKTNRYLAYMSILFSVALITACIGGGSSGNNTTTTSYRITLMNLTNSQPLSPMAIIVHNDAFSAWEIGASASIALENLAESGSPADLIQAADGDPDVMATATGNGVIMPGAEEIVDITVDSLGVIHLTLTTMLVNTNDAFGGVIANSLDQLAVGQSVIFVAPTYDAGTEANSESIATVPGPAAGGEGFNAARDDVDFVHIHPGVISSQDGLAGSILTGAHRWDNPVFKLVVTRLS